MTAQPKPPRTSRKARRTIARKSRPARVRKTPRSKLKRQADALWSSIVRAAGKCRICGSGERLQAAHGFSRRYLGTRHDLRNGWCLCSGCHKTMGYRAIEWDALMRADLGVLYEPMRQEALKRCVPDYEWRISQLRAATNAGR